LARFVDTLSATPTVRLDVNDGSLWRLQATSRMDPPRARRARAATMLVDGAIYPSTSYDDRVLELHWQLDGASTDEVATQVQLLARELDRPGNIFQYQPPGATHPVFFRTHRLGLDSVDVPTDGTQLDLVVSVPAEPFAYGLPQTLSSVTVNNNPAHATNGMHFDISGVLGDVETPLVLRINHADTVESWRRQSIFAVRRRGTPSATPFFLQAEAMTQGTNTSVQANDATMSGSGSNFSRTTFGTATMQTRLSTGTGFHPSSDSVDARGRYRVYLRYRKSVSGDTITVKLLWGDVNAPVSNDTMTLPSGTSRRYVDLGDVQIPVGADAATDLTGAARSAIGNYIAVQAARTGSGNLDMDLLLFVPADDRLALIDFYQFTGPTYTWVDSVNDTVFATNGAGATSPRVQSIAVGGLPMVSPGATNRIFVVGDVSPSAASDDITKTMTIVPSYLPRYLFVRPPSS
jgi:hypothetical protein